MVDLALALLIWLGVIGAIWRGFRHERRVNRFAFRAWIIFIFIALVFTFRSPPVEAIIDAQFGGQPVTFWLNALSTLGAAVVYAIAVLKLVETSEEEGTRRSHPKLVGAAGVVGLGLCLVLAASVNGAVTRQQAQYGMRLLLEFYVLLLLIFMLIPINVGMFRRETVRPMRVKHAAVIVSFLAYAAGAVAATLFIPPILITGHVNPGPDCVPRVAIGAVCLMVMLLPHKRLRVLLLPLHLYRYLRIASLECFLDERVGFEREPLAWRQALRSQYVEIATYVAVINILDYYRHLRAEDPDEHLLYRKIAALLPSHLAYDDLVVALSRISV
ncbi:MAG: hypothetical protein GYB65_05675 [Chloroflexi bacterium]|nr:hypothetical protein [Chloroflexota bacterium]